MTSLESIMNKEIITISPLDSVRKAADMMNNLKVGCFPVVEGEKLIGIITSRDIRHSHPNRLVIDAMSKNLITVQPTCSIWDAAEIMERHGIERLMITENGNLWGIVTNLQVYHEIGKHIDPLTGLNRAEFLYYIANKLFKNNGAIIFIDLDGFGEIDKEHGHVVGDEILRRVSLIIRTHTEENLDYPCRYAGDEFAVVTTRFSDAAKRYALKIVNAIASNNWPDGIKITASAGVVNWHPTKDNDCDIRKLVNAASLASTKAKRNGVSVIMLDF